MAWRAYIRSLVASDLFPPQQITHLREMVHQAPINFGLRLSRWTLEAIRQVCDWLRHYTLSGIWRILRAFRIHSKRGQEHVHSPDPDYVGKRDWADACVEGARAQPGEVVTLYLDEFSYYRWPTVASVYHEAGRRQPRAELAPRYNTRGRIVLALDVVQGNLLYRQRSRITVRELVGFIGDIRRAYPEAKVINVIQDNWHNVHFHPDQKKAAEESGITLVPLPVYAAWLNPTEKVGRKLRQEILHMHQQSDDWPQLKERVRDWLDQFADGSPDLLRYVGLLPDQ